MKLKVRITFRDKETNKVYRPGEIIDIADEGRVQDMLNRKLCEAVEGSKTTAKEKTPKKSGNTPKTSKEKSNTKAENSAEGSAPADGEGTNSSDDNGGDPENQE